MKRRSLLVMLVALPGVAFCQIGAVARIALLTDLVKALGAAGEAITKITEGFKSLVVAGKDSYNYVAAERERARLLDISRRTAQLIATQNVSVIEVIGQYLATPIKTQENWSRVVVNLESTLSAVQTLLSDVQKEEGAFVLEPAYLTLNQVLSGRARLLGQLATMPAPTSPEELALLSDANERYKLLVKSAREALVELNAYVKMKK